MTQESSLTKSGTKEEPTSESHIQLQMMIKTQFFHFSNVVFPEFSKSMLRLSPQWLVLLKTTKNQAARLATANRSNSTP